MVAAEMMSAQTLFASLSPPDTDETVREYVCSLLEEADPGETNVEELIDTLQGFLGADEEQSEYLARDLVNQWKAKKKSTKATAAAPPPKAKAKAKADPSKKKAATLMAAAAPASPTRSPAQSDQEGGGELSPKSHKEARQQRKAAARAARKANKRSKTNKKGNNKNNHDHESSDSSHHHDDEALTRVENWADKDDDDFATAWNECKEQGKLWGGRGHGGRGVQAGSNSIHSNIHLANVTISVPGGGLELLNQAQFDLARGHRYGLIGRNGCGKSTLLKRLAAKNIPGLPQDLNILLVQQEMEGSDTETALQVLLKADTYRQQLLNQQEQLEQQLEQTDDSNIELLEEIAMRLGEVSEELDARNADQAEQKAHDILKGLQFTTQMINSPTNSLSGGWRVRLALARALFLPSDILLLDETSNHLDIWGVQWLTNYLTNSSDQTQKIVMVVSHDRAFLDAICTDIMVIEHGKLKTFPGSWSDYEIAMEEKMEHKKRILDASDKQKAKAQQFIQKQQAMAHKKSADPNKQRQAKMMKEKKLERMGNYREDGKRYKNFSLAKLDMDYLRVAEKVHIEADEPVVRMKFPNPTWPPGVSHGSPLIQMESFSFSYQKGISNNSNNYLLKNLTLNVNRGSKIAVVGNNGSGKSTLLKLLTGDIAIPNKEHQYSHKGSLSWKHSNLRIGHMTQYSVEELNKFADMTVVQYAEEKLKRGKASGVVVAEASGNVRQYLGAFGLGGIHAHRKIEKLSGGERMRLCFATVFAEEPHILFLDEATNHVDVETLDSMAAALNKYEGAVLMVSHNQSFLSGFCKELWVVGDGHVTCNYNDSESLDELFSDYRNAVLADIGGSTMTNRRTEKANLARKANKSRAGAKQNVAFI